MTRVAAAQGDSRPADRDPAATEIALSGAWACATVRLDRHLHHWDRLLLVVEDGPAEGVCRKPRPGSAGRQGIETWMKLVIASTTAFLLALVMNQVMTIVLASTGAGPEIPHWLDQRYLFLAAWGFPVLAVWGFNARWLPVFLGLGAPSGGGLLMALAICSGGIGAAMLGQFLVATVMLLAASILACLALRVFQRSLKPAKTLGVSASFPYFVRGAYVWLLAAAALGVYAAVADSYGGIWGASRHSLTVGFLATMVFAIGQRVLPASGSPESGMSGSGGLGNPRLRRQHRDRLEPSARVRHGRADRGGLVRG